MNYEEFCELAPLYVLDVLDAKERRLLEDYIAQFPESEAHLDELAETLAMMPYSLPERTMATNLKARLFERIADEAVADNHQSITYPAMGTHLPLFTVRPADVRWQPHPVPGVAIAKLYEDPVRREIVCLLRAQAGVYYPCHRHAGAEEIFMLEGDLVVNGEVYGTGDYIRSAPGTIHNPHTVNGCMFFIRTSLDDEILN
jgi:anti-sigma factor ChrR (cupin superfamily)